MATRRARRALRAASDSVGGLGVSIPRLEAREEEGEMKRSSRRTLGEVSTWLL